MRLAVWHNLPSGGGRRALFDQLRGLRRQGHDIEVWCPPIADQDFLPLDGVGRQHVLPLDLPQPIGLLSKLSPYIQSGPLRRMEAMDAHARAFADAVRQTRFDLVLAHPCQWFYTPFVGRYLTLPSVLYLHEPCRELYEARPQLPWIAEPESPYPLWHPTTMRTWIGSAARVHACRVQAREELTSARSFTRVLVNSWFSREGLLKTFGLNARVAYLGIDTTTFFPGTSPREPFVLSVGEFVAHKNPALVVRAVAASGTRLPLVWVANRTHPETLAECRTLAAELGVALDVRVLVSTEELVDLYRRCAIFAYAPALEPFGYAPLEAGACGAPVVAVCGGGVRETVVPNMTGLLVEPEVEAMAEAFKALTRDPEHARSLGERAARRVKEQWTLAEAEARLETHLLEVHRSWRPPSGPLAKDT